MPYISLSGGIICILNFVDHNHTYYFELTDVDMNLNSIFSYLRMIHVIIPARACIFHLAKHVFHLMHVWKKGIMCILLVYCEKCYK
jgi:hypothetical protein